MRKLLLFWIIGFMLALSVASAAPVQEDPSFTYDTTSTWTDPNVVYVEIELIGVGSTNIYRLYNVTTTSLCEADLIIIHNGTDPNTANVANATCTNNVCDFGDSGVNMSADGHYKIVARKIGGSNWEARHDTSPGFDIDGTEVRWDSGGYGVPGSGWTDQQQARCIESIWGEEVDEGETLPSITFYNMTSEGGEGCTNWNTDKSDACTTSDTTPTVFIKTDEDASCSIGVEDKNFTDLGASRECSGGGSS